MFLQNKYANWYYGIIQNAKNENRKKNKNIYYERHHIIPKCDPFSGSNEKTNLVLLSPREHFLCHWLLIKMCEGEYRWKMKHALARMMKNNDITEAHLWVKWQYALGTKMRSQAMSDRANVGKTPNQGKKHSDEAKLKMRNAKLGKPRPELTIEVRGARKHSKETKDKIIESLKGRPVSEETREKLRISNRGKKQIRTIMICEVCGNENYVTQIKRYHNDNCKNKHVGIA